MSLKEKIIENEELLLKYFEQDYGKHIKYFIAKIKALDYDGDIVNFMNNDTLPIQKKDQYNAIHAKNLRTALDITMDYPKDNLKYLQLDDLKIGDLLTTMNISALAKNFNTMKGMYYNVDKDILIIKSQVKDGPYNNNWINRNKEMKYYLESEKYEDSYYNLNYSHLPNQVCRDIILGNNKTTKMYLFYRYSEGDRYFYAGEYKPIRFIEDNHAIILKNNQDNNNFI